MDRDLYSKLGQAAYDNDSIAEEHNRVSDVWQQLGLDVEAVMEFAMQRGLRVRMIETGRQAELASLRLDSRLKPVAFSQEDQLAIARYAATVADGMATMLRYVIKNWEVEGLD